MRRQGVPQFLAAAIAHPGIGFGAGQAIGHGGEEIERLVLALKIIFRRIVHFGIALGNSVEHLKCGNQFAGAKDLDLDLALGKLVNAAGHPLAGGAKAWQI